MILIQATGTDITSISKISSDNKALEFLAANTSFMQAPADFDDAYPIQCYEYVDGVVQLKADWETIESQIVADTQALHDTRPRAFRQQTDAVQAQGDSRVEAGAPFNGVRWPADSQSVLEKASVAASVGSGRGLPKNKTTVTARDINRTKYEMPQTDYMDMAAAVRDYVFDVKETADNHIDALLALMADETKTSADISAYDVTTGWPE